MAKINFHLSFGLVSMPVALEAAAREDKVSFNQITPDGGGVSQRLVNKETGMEVAKSDLRRGFQLSNGTYAIVTESELEACAPKSSKIIEISEFVEADSVDPIYFDASYYVSPKAAGDKAYALLYDTLRTSGKYAIAKATMFGRETVVVIRAAAGGLVLHRCFYEHEVRASREFRTEVAQLDPKEVSMAAMVVDLLSTGGFEPSKFRDTYTETLRALCTAKEAGVVVSGSNVTAPDILELLRQSVDEALAAKAGLGDVMPVPRLMVPASENLTPLLTRIVQEMEMASSA